MQQAKITDKEIENLDQIISHTNQLMKQFPNDHLIKISIEQAVHRKKILLTEQDRNENSVPNQYSVSS